MRKSTKTSPIFLSLLAVAFSFSLIGCGEQTTSDGGLSLPDSSQSDGGGSSIENGSSSESESSGTSESTSGSFEESESSGASESTSGSFEESDLTGDAAKYWSGVTKDGSVYGAAFRKQLYTIMDKSTATNSYKALNKILKLSDPGKGGGVHPFYRASGESSTSWNKEHVWPNSRGAGESSGYAGTDPQVIRPTNTADNSSRSNYMYNVVPSGTKVTSSTGWDPASFGYEAARGESARIILYAATRYYKESTASAGGTSHGSEPLELTETITESSNSHTMGKLSCLLKWNMDYPVTAEETYRNNYLAGEGYARNPFIDQPDWANFIWTNDASIGGTKSNNYMRTASYSPIIKDDEEKPDTSSSSSTSEDASTSEDTSTSIPEGDTFTLLPKDFPTSYDESIVERTLNGQKFNVAYFSNFNSSIQIKKAKGELINSVAFGKKVSSIQIALTGGTAPSLSYGDNAASLTSASFSAAGSFVLPSAASYIKLSASPDGVGNLSSIVYTFAA